MESSTQPSTLVRVRVAYRQISSTSTARCNTCSSTKKWYSDDTQVLYSSTRYFITEIHCCN